MIAHNQALATRVRNRHGKPLRAIAVTAGWILFATFGTAAAEPATFRGADHALGRELIARHACAACHQRKAGGDGNAVYRPEGRIRTPESLVSMVERCSTELSLGLFPEEVVAIAAVLNSDFYRIGLRPK